MSQLMRTLMRTKKSFLVPLEVSQELSSCVTGAAKYALDSGQGLILQILCPRLVTCSKASAVVASLSATSLSPSIPAL